MQKIKCLSSLLFLSLFVSYAYSQASWDPAFSSLDNIEQNVLKLQTSNEVLQNFNEDLKKRLENSEANAKILLQISLQQEELLTQWENNWLLTQEILTAQSVRLENYEKLCKGLKIGIPIAITASIGIGILIGVMVNVNK